MDTDTEKGQPTIRDTARMDAETLMYTEKRVQAQARANEQSECQTCYGAGWIAGDYPDPRFDKVGSIRCPDCTPAVADKGHRHELYTVGYYIRCHACGQEWSSAQQVYDAGLIDGRGQ